MGLDGDSEVPLYGHEELLDQPGQWAPEIPSSFDFSPRKSFISDVLSVPGGQQSSAGQDGKREEEEEKDSA